MELTYDPDYNIAYLQLGKCDGSGSAPQLRTVGVSDELNVDLAPDGSVYGIELLNANAQLGASARIAVGPKDHERRKTLPLVGSGS